MILPDHPTPLAIRTHSNGKVPFVIYDSRKDTWNPDNAYNEETASKSGLSFDMGYKLTDYFFKGVANL
jgi:2,3-bisphosphoglycerate-independent phosphoglycerate mutase